MNMYLNMYLNMCDLAAFWALVVFKREILGLIKVLDVIDGLMDNLQPYTSTHLLVYFTTSSII